jgi:hypothetical protein
MTVSQDEIRRRPQRVIILDADDPMTEIEGRFVWQEEHERVVEETRRAAFDDGYAKGVSDANQAREPAALQVQFRPRHNPLRKLKLAVLVVGLMCLLIALPVVVYGG